MYKQKILNTISEEEKLNSIEKLRALKEITLKQFSLETRNALTKIIDELACEVIFQFHMELKINIADSKLYGKPSNTSEESLITMAKELSINNVNKNIYCPNCSVKIKCLWLSRHLNNCMNFQQSTYSGRNSSRLARKRIQKSFDEIIDIDDSDDEKVKKKKCKGRKSKLNLSQNK